MDKVQPVNAASVKHDGEYDVINFRDAIHILLYIAGWTMIMLNRFVFVFGSMNKHSPILKGKGSEEN